MGFQLNGLVVGVSLLALLGWPEKPRSQETQLRFVTWKSQQAWVWDRAIADFETRNRGVKVVREIGPHSSTEFHDLLAQKLTNRDAGVDVFYMDVIWPPEFAAAGWALPLDRFFPAREREQFLEAPILANTYHGRIYGVPGFIDAGMLYYRRDLLRKYGFSPPRAWPELVEQAKTILRQENDSQLTGFSGQFKQYEGLVCNMMEYILGNGGSLWDEKELKSLVHLPRAKEAVRFVRDRIIGEISHRGVLAYQEPESLALFVQGRAIFHRNWPYAWQISNDPQTSRVAGRVGVAPLPAFVAGKSASTLGGWQLGISRFSTRPELAWKFISFMTGREIQKRIAMFAARAPARKDLYRDPDVLGKQPQFGSQFEALTNAVPRPRTPVYVPLSNVLQRYFSSALSLRDSPSDQLAGLASRDMDRILDLLRGSEAQ